MGLDEGGKGERKVGKKVGRKRVGDVLKKNILGLACVGLATPERSGKSRQRRKIGCAKSG